MITILIVILGFLFICLCGGVIFYVLLDLKPWKKKKKDIDEKVENDTDSNH